MLLKLLKQLASINAWQCWLPSIVQYFTQLQQSQSFRNKICLYLIKFLIYSWLTIMSLRCLIVAASGPLKWNLTTTYFKYDAVVRQFCQQLHFFDPSMALAISLSPIYGIFTDWAMYFHIESATLELFNDVIVENGVEFFNLNETLMLGNDSGGSLLGRMIRKLQTCLAIWKGTEINEHKLKFAKKRLINFPNITKSLRAKTVLLTLVSSLNIVFSCVLFFAIFTTVAAMFLGILLPKVTGFQKLFVLYDITLMVYCSWNTNRMGLIGLNCVNIPKFIYTSHMKMLNSQLAQLIADANRHKQTSTQKLNSFLIYFQAEHSQLMQNVLILTRIGSQWLFISFISQGTLNIWLVSVLIFRQLIFGEKLLMYGLVIGQVAMGLVACNIFISLCDVLHSPAKYLVQTQVLLRFKGNFNINAIMTTLRMKLKLAHFYEMLHTNRKICFTFGPLGELSKKAVIEFLFFYSAGLMTVSKLVRDS